MAQAGTPRDALMAVLMESNNALLRIKDYARDAQLTPAQDDFLRVVPYHEQIIYDVADYVFTLPEDEPLMLANVKQRALKQRSETENIDHFDALTQFIRLAFPTHEDTLTE